MKKAFRLCTDLLFISGMLFLLSSCASDAGDKKKTNTGCATVAWGVALDGYPVTKDKLNMLAKEVGEKPDIVSFFLSWPAPEKVKEREFSPDSLDAIHSFGSLPCFTWEPMYFRKNKEKMVPSEMILDGSYDLYIRHVAKVLRKWKHPVLLRFAHEMNLERYHWGTEKEKYGPDSPAIYRRMFHYVVDIFNEESAYNVAWVFCPNAESVPGGKYEEWNNAAAYYPGDNYVDILGMDGYNWGVSRTKDRHGWESRWRAFVDIFSSMYGQLRELSSQKPLLIFETASVMHGGDRRLWLQEAGEVIKEWNLTGVIWFQVQKENDWRLKEGDLELLLKGLKARRVADDSTQAWLRGILNDKK